MRCAWATHPVRTLSLIAAGVNQSRVLDLGTAADRSVDVAEQAVTLLTRLRVRDRSLREHDVGL